MIQNKSNINLNINTNNLFYNSLIQIFDIKYFSNFVIYVCILAYILKIYDVFYLFYPILIVNSILCLYIILFKWHIVGFTAYNKVFNNNQSLKEKESIYQEFKNINKENPIRIFLVKILIYVYHIIPIIYFIKKSIITEFWKYKNVKNIVLIIITIIICCIYKLYIDDKYQIYGEINSNIIMINGILLYIIIVNTLFN